VFVVNRDGGSFLYDVQTVCEDANFAVDFCFDVVIQKACWVIWQFRNKFCLDDRASSIDTLEDEIKTLSYGWITHRNSNLCIGWYDLIMDPLHASIHYNTFLFVLAFNLVSSSLIKSLAFKKNNKKK
jgi:hypothetical protein